MSKSENRYTDGQYLEKTATWHIEDSPYKIGIVAEAIRRNRIQFSNCADIGCGAGKVIEGLAKKYPDAKFTGYEISPDVKSFWSKNEERKNLEYRNENIFDGEYSTDLVISLDVFEHVEDYFTFLRNARKIGDHFIFNIPLDMCALKMFTSGIRRAREDVGHLHYFNTYTAKQALLDTGYEIIEAKISVAFLKIPPRNLLQALVLPLRISSLLFGKWFANAAFGGMSLLVTARNPDRTRG
jgi:SAM-dependent methyltransferase